MKSSGILILALALCIPAAVLLPGACSGGFAKKPVPLRYVCNDVRYGGFYASGHFPVYVDFEIN